MKFEFCRRSRLVGGLFALAATLLMSPHAFAQSISGSAINHSRWADTNAVLNPPGDGNGVGVLSVGAWNGSGDIQGPPATSVALLGPGSMPFTYGLATNYTISGLPPGTYQIIAWVDANQNGEYDLGEPRSAAQAVDTTAGSVVGYNVVVLDDSDFDTLPDYWEAHYFAGSETPLGFGAGDDPDKDGLSNSQELSADTDPANWDSDGDSMDDGFEVKYRGDTATNVLYLGLNPRANDAASDADGDGLSNFQEYRGVDGVAPVAFDTFNDGIYKAKTQVTSDTLNPLDIDTDFDLLIDSFEAAWYDPANGIDPVAGKMTNFPSSGVLDFSIAGADADEDGLSNYREQCLQMSFREGGANGDKWVWLQEPFPVPFPYHLYPSLSGAEVRMCNLGGFSGGTPLGFAGLNPLTDIRVLSSRNALRAPATGWTDPTDGSGYNLVDENPPSGHDTDNDGLPDGWEVEFALDARDPGTGPSFTNGPFGDPDGDGILNFEEYVGQDGNRSATRPYVNGTGDETNPNQHPWRPDSTYQWRWLLTNALVTPITDPRAGSGLRRAETLGGALPTLSIGSDNGTDTDDDGIPDSEEINPSTSAAPSSPVHSTDPFIQRSALITSTAGLVVPDPEAALASIYAPAGVREDLQRRDWTIECMVNLQDVNLSGSIFDFNTALAGNSRVVYRLQLSNNVPVLTADINGSRQTVSGNALPTNKWVHLAAVWDHANNNLALYIQGVLFIGKSVFGESASVVMYPATNTLAFGASAGSFVNKLMIDEIRIWGVARSARQISDFSAMELPQSNGDDVWIAGGGGAQFYGTNDTLLVNGGSIFEGEPGIPLSNVLSYAGNYWIDNGNGSYQSSTDILIYHGSDALSEGSVGSPVANVRYNDKDGSGGYSRDSLLAYYRFDDGGSTVEDFARKAKNGLKNATVENYGFGDFGYAIPVVGFSVVTTDAAIVLGVDRRASDDTDGDGLPDAWETVYHLDPLDNGAGGESAVGAKDGPFGALADLDGDGLSNIYEFRAGTNPREKDSDGNSISDALEDYDGDGVVNLTEQQLGSRPDLVDTDDDGLTDSQEQSLITSPISPVDPPTPRGMLFGGAVDDYLNVPLAFKQRLTTWTLEAMVRPNSVAAGQGVIVRRLVQELGGGTNALNYVLGIETNGAGGLRAYAGYVLSNGQRFILSGGSLATGVYTQVAATYDNATATLVLYVGGNAVASNNTFNLAPPVNGKGGDTFLRIGEDFGGEIDEVRIWNVARSAGVIASNAAKTVVSTDPTLVHYFRFDDGQATNNIIAFGPNHQPAGAQDFTVANDWDQQWRHAAKVHGNIQVTAPGGVLPPPSLRVNLSPAGALAEGAQWSVDGGPFNDSGVVLDLATGVHAIVYRTISGYTAPTNESVVVSNGAVTTLSRFYLQNGALLVNLEPSAAVATGALYRVDGGAFLASGTVVTNLSPGSHFIEYKAIVGWIEPTTEVVNVLSASTVSVTRAYAPAMGYLQVNLLPTNAVAGGAVWRASGGAWNNTGIRILLQGGDYTVEYQPVTGWITPSNEVVSVFNAQTTVLTRVYVQDQSLTDSDNDGLPDNWEVQYFGDLQQNGTGDFDNDGLNNLREYQLGTNPANPDTDGDGFMDGIEVNRGSDPLNPLSIPKKTEFNDFDGDGATDLVVYNRNTGTWYVRKSSNGAQITKSWGYPAAVAAPADFDGDDITDFAVCDVTTGRWYEWLSTINDGKSVSWMWAADSIPCPADYNGDNKADLCMFRQSIGNWNILLTDSNNPAGVTKSFNWGWSQTKPVPGDYDGDGKIDAAVFYPSYGYWYVLSSLSSNMYKGKPLQWGWSGTTPVPGDYDGDRKTDLAVFDKTASKWYILQSSNNQIKSGGPIQWGFSGVEPIPGDYDNDGKTDIAVYHRATGKWYILQSSNNQIKSGGPIPWGWSETYPPHSP